MKPFVYRYAPNASSYNVSTLFIQYASSDTHLDTTWFEYGGVNTTLVGNTTFQKVEGANDLIIWANDTVKNLNRTEPFTVRVDTQPPNATIDNTSSVIGRVSSVMVQGTCVDQGIAGLSYAYTNSSFFQGVDSTPSVFNLSNTTNLPVSGVVTVDVFCNDTFGNNLFFQELTFTMDEVDPFVYLYSPNATHYNVSTLNLLYTSSDTHLDKTWFQYNNINTTLISNTTFQAIDGSNLLTLWANDTAFPSNMNKTSWLVQTDTQPPNVSIDNKSGEFIGIVSTISINGVCSDQGIAGLDSAYTNSSLFTSVDSTAAIFNLTNTSAVDGFNEIYVFCNDTYGNNLHFAVIRFIVDLTSPVVTINQPTDNYYPTAQDISGTCTGTNLNTTYTNSSSYSGVDTTPASFLFSNTSAIGDGRVSVKVYCNNSANTTSYAEAHYWLDSVVPRPVILSPNASHYNTSTLDLLEIVAYGLQLNYTWFQYGAVNTTIPNGANTTFASLEGSNDLILWANSSAGLLNRSATFTTLVDTQPPNTTIDNTSNYLKGSVISIDGTCKDDGIAGLQNAYTNSSFFTTIDGTPTIFNFTNTSAIDGPLTVWVFCNDTFGNSRSSFISFVVDNTNPVVTITTPTDGYYGSAQAITGTCTDTNSNTTYTNSTFYQGIGATPSFSFPNTSSIGDGRVNVRVFCNDSANNTAFADAFYTLDTTFPDSALLSPNRSIYNVTSINLLEIARDNIQLNTTWYQQPGPTSVNVTLANGANTTYTGIEGSNQVILWVNDSAGNTNHSEIKFYDIDTQPPNLTIDNVSDRHIPYSPLFYINGFCSDSPSSATTYAAWTNSTYFPDIFFAPGIVNSGFNFTNSSGPIPDGFHRVYIFCNDTAGNNLFWKEFNFTLITTTPFVSITAPPQTYINYPQVNLAGVCSGVSIDSAYTNRSEFNQVDDTPSVFSWLNNSAISNGPFSVRVYCNDTANNTGFTDWSFIYDNQNPFVYIFSPNASKYNTSTFNLLEIASDNIQLNTTWYQYGAGPNVTIANGANATIAKKEGSTLFTLWVNDSTGGNMNRSQFTTNFDTQPPNLTVDNGTNVQMSYHAVVTWNIRVHDDGIAGLDSVWSNSTLFTGVFPVSGADGYANITNTSGIPDGDYTLYFFVNDSYNNLRTVHVHFKFDTANPVVNVVFPLDAEYNYAPNIIGTCTGPTVLDSVMTNDTRYSGVFSPASFSISNTSAVGDGRISIRVNCNNTVNTIGFEDVFWTMDTVAPFIYMFAPNASKFNTTTFDVLYIESDANTIDNTWAEYGGTNYTLSNGINSTLTTLPGSNQIRLWVNDSAGNLNKTDAFTVNADLLPPNITVDNTTMTIPYSSSIMIQGTCSDTGIGSVDSVYTNSTYFPGIDSTGAIWNLTNSSVPIPDGPVHVYIFCNDTYGNNLFWKEFTFTLDTVAPVVTTTAPSDAYYKTAQTITGTCTDVNVQSVYTNSTFYTGVYSSSFSISNTSNIGTSGPVSVRVYCNDTANNTAYTDIHYILDLDKPNSAVLSPNQTIYNVSSLNLLEIASDNIQLNTTWFEFNGVNTTLANGANTTITAPEGTGQVVRLWVNDSAGNTNYSVSTTFTVDLSPPNITFSNTSGLTIAYSPDITIKGTCTDVAPGNAYAVWTNSSEFTQIQFAPPINTTGFALQNTSAVSDGFNRVYVFCNDTAGNNLFWKEFNFTLDSVAPSVFIHSPNASHYNVTTLNLLFSATDTNLDKVWYEYNGANITLVSNTTFTAVDGSQELLVWANDTVSHYSFASVTVNTDFRPPNVTADNTTSLIRYSPSIMIQGTCVDQGIAGLDSAYTNSTYFQGVDSTAAIWNLTNTSAIPDTASPIQVYVFCNDTFGNNLHFALVQFTLDSVKPFVFMYSPNATHYNTTTFPLQYTSSDLHLDKTWYQYGSNANVTLSGNTTVSKIEGNNTIIIWSNDTVNNLNRTQAFQVKVDTMPPNISLTNVTPDSISYHQVITVEGTCSDQGIAGVDSVYSNSTYFQGIDSTGASWLLQNTSGIPDGTFDIYFICNDTYGNNLDFVKYTLTIDTTNPAVDVHNPKDAYYPSPPYIEGDCEDFGHVLDSVYTNSTYYQQILPTGGGQTFFYNFSSNTSNLPNGRYAIRVYCNDSTNNTGFADAYFWFDQEKPDIAVLAPNASHYNTTTFDVLELVSDNIAVNYTWIEYSGTNYTIANGANTTLNTVEGSHVLIVWANDSASNLNMSAPFTVNADLRPPNVTIDNTTTIISPKGDVTIQGTCVDQGIAGLDSAYTNSTYFTGIDGTASIFNLTNTTNLGDGAYQVFVFCNDTFGNNLHFAVLTFTVDTSVPVINLELPKDDYYNTPQEISGTCTNTHLDTAYTNLSYYAGIDTSPSIFNFTNTSTLPGNSRISFTVACNDTANNTVSATGHFWYDISAPSLVVYSPNTTNFNTSTFNLLEIVTDNFGVNTTFYEYAGTNYTIANGANASVPKIEGSNNFILWANDSSKNLNRSGVFNLTFDTRPPNTTIDNTTSTVNNTPTIMIQGTCHDEGAAGLSAAYTNSTLFTGVIPLSGHDGIFNLTNTSALSNSAFTVYVFCNDTFGNNRNFSVLTFTVTSPVPVTPPSGGGGGGGGGGGYYNFTCGDFKCDYYNYGGEDKTTCPTDCAANISATINPTVINVQGAAGQAMKCLGDFQGCTVTINNTNKFAIWIKGEILQGEEKDESSDWAQFASSKSHDLLVQIPAGQVYNAEVLVTVPSWFRADDFRGAKHFKIIFNTTNEGGRVDYYINFGGPLSFITGSILQDTALNDPTGWLVLIGIVLMILILLFIWRREKRKERVGQKGVWG